MHTHTGDKAWASERLRIGAVANPPTRPYEGWAEFQVEPPALFALSNGVVSGTDRDGYVLGAVGPNGISIGKISCMPGQAYVLIKIAEQLH